MKLDGLYATMKDALDYFGLSWSQKHLVEVSIRGDEVVFSYGCKSASAHVGAKREGGTDD